MPLRGLRLSEDLKTRLEQAQKLRGYRSVNAFILEAIEEKLQRTDAVESVSEPEARIAADFSRIVREVRSVHNTQQPQYALLDALTKYALLDPRKRVHARLSLLSCILDFVGLVQEMYFSFHAFDHEVNAVAVFFLAMPQHTPLNMGCFSEVCHGQR